MDFYGLSKSSRGHKLCQHKLKTTKKIKKFAINFEKNVLGTLESILDGYPTL